MPGRVAAHARSYCGRVVACTCALACYVAALLPSPPITIQFLYRDSSPLPRGPRSLSRAHSAVSQRRVARARCRIAALPLVVSQPKGRLSHDTIFVSRHSSPVAKPSCARAARSTRRPAYRRLPGRVVVPYWPYHGPCCAPLCAYVTIQLDVS